MFSEANLVSNGQSFSGDEGKALSAKPLESLSNASRRNAAFLTLIADQRATPELELVQCLSLRGLVLQEVTGVQSAQLPFPARCLISQNSFY